MATNRQPTTTQTGNAARAEGASLRHTGLKTTESGAPIGQKVPKSIHCYLSLVAALAGVSPLVCAQPARIASSALSISIKDKGTTEPELSDLSRCTYVSHIGLQTHREVINKSCAARRPATAPALSPKGTDTSTQRDGVLAKAETQTTTR